MPVAGFACPPAAAAGLEETQPVEYTGGIEDLLRRMLGRRQLVAALVFFAELLAPGTAPRPVIRELRAGITTSEGLYVGDAVRARNRTRLY